MLLVVSSPSSSLRRSCNKVSFGMPLFIDIFSTRTIEEVAIPVFFVCDFVVCPMLIICMTESSPLVVKQPRSKMYIREASRAANPMTNGNAVWL